jgi:hypothetical protein
MHISTSSNSSAYEKEMSSRPFFPCKFILHMSIGLQCGKAIGDPNIIFVIITNKTLTNNFRKGGGRNTSYPVRLGIQVPQIGWAMVGWVTTGQSLTGRLGVDH